MGNPSTPHSAAIPMNTGGGVGGGQGVPRMTAPMGTLPEPVSSNRSLLFSYFLSLVPSTSSPSCSVADLISTILSRRWEMKVHLVLLNDQVTIPLHQSLLPQPVSNPIIQLVLQVTQPRCHEHSIQEAREKDISTIREEEEEMLTKDWLILIVSRGVGMARDDDRGFSSLYLSFVSFLVGRT